MAISREKKEELVAQYTDLLQQSQGVVVTDYHGMNMNQLTELRTKLGETGGQYMVVKNTLLLLAMEAVGMEVPESLVDGPVALGLLHEDISGAVKVLLDAGGDDDLSVSVKGGIIAGDVLNPEQLKRLTELPTLPELRSQILGLFTSPASGIVGLLEEPARGVVGVVGAASSQLLNVVAAYAAKAEEEAA